MGMAEHGSQETGKPTPRAAWLGGAWAPRGGASPQERCRQAGTPRRECREAGMLTMLGATGDRVKRELKHRLQNPPPHRSSPNKR